MDKTLQTYYSRRAQEYESIYHRNDPLRQSELESIRQTVTKYFVGKRVLEIACGTGYWTEAVAPVAQQITATDFSLDMLQVAQNKPALQTQVDFKQADAYELDTIRGAFDAGLANFWFSHIPKARISQFLRGFHKRLEPGALVFMCDNLYVPGVGGELIQKSNSEDTFKLRTLSYGSNYEILKNYFTREELQAIFEPHSTELTITIGQCFWWIQYHVA